MKKSLFALAILGAFAGAASAQTSVTMYGVVDAGVSRDNNGTASTTRLDSGIQSGSRLGFRGTEDLGGGLKGLFVLETGINVDQGGFGQSNKAFGRQAYVGLNSGLGTLKLGRQTTLLRNALDAIDPFHIGLAGSAERFFNDSGSLDVAGGKSSGRMDNTVSYATPNFAGFTGQFQYGFGEVPGNSKASTQVTASAQYENGPLLVSLTQHNIQNATDTNKEKITLAGATYDFSVVKVHTLFDYDRNDSNSITHRDQMVGVTVPFGPHAFLFDYTRRTDKALANQAESKQYALGYTYAMSKRTNLYTSYSNTKNDGAASLNVVAPGATDKLFDVGVRHTF